MERDKDEGISSNSEKKQFFEPGNYRQRDISFFQVEGASGNVFILITGYAFPILVTGHEDALSLIPG